MPFLCAISNYTSMCQNQLRKSGLDLRDLDLGVGLSVALCSAIAFFRLHLVDADLLALAVFDDIAGNDGVFHHGGAENSLVLVDDSQNAVKLHSLAGLDIQLLDEDDVALSHAVLLTAGNDDSVLQTRCTCLSVESRSCGWEAHLRLVPTQCGLDSLSFRTGFVNGFSRDMVKFFAGIAILRRIW